MYDYSKLPDHIRPAVKAYVEEGQPVGDFLTAVICNDMKNSMRTADEVNRARLFDIVGVFYNETPIDCWGSPENMAAWMAHKGLSGIPRPVNCYLCGSRFSDANLLSMHLRIEHKNHEEDGGDPEPEGDDNDVPGEFPGSGGAG